MMVLRNIAIIAAFALFAGVLDGHAHKRRQRGYWKERVYHWETCSFDPASVRHPENIYYIRLDMDMYLDFCLPYEREQSGVANLFFRNRNSGEVHMLDRVTKVWKQYVGDEDDGTPVYITDITDDFRRYITRFEPGIYDAILLYNNGKYIIYESFTFAPGEKMIVDMRQLPVREMDADSREWLAMRKFTDPIVERRISKDPKTLSPYKAAGYVFEYGGTPTGMHFKRSGDRRPVANTTMDGYFEVDSGEKGVKYRLHLDDLSDTIYAKANTWLFIVIHNKRKEAFWRKVREWEDERKRREKEAGSTEGE